MNVISNSRKMICKIIYTRSLYNENKNIVKIECERKKKFFY